MFGKLLKHDFLAIARKAIPLSIAALVGAIIGGISMNLLNNTGAENNPLLDVLLSLGSAASVIMIIAAVIGIQIFIYSHFYQNLFTDEGYLTFTLPVKRSSILLSKTLNAIIWTAISVVLAALLATVTEFCSGAPIDILAPLKWIIFLFKEASLSEAIWVVIYTFEIFLIVIAVAVMQINLIQFCITFGSTLAKKHKILASFGIYYATNAALSFSSQILLIFFAGSLSDWFSSFSDTDPLSSLSATALILFAVFLILAAIAVLFYTLSLRRIKNHLNIA